MGEREKSLRAWSSPVTPIVFASVPTCCPNAAVPKPRLPEIAIKHS